MPGSSQEKETRINAYKSRLESKVKVYTPASLATTTNGRVRSVLTRGYPGKRRNTNRRLLTIIVLCDVDIYFLLKFIFIKIFIYFFLFLSISLICINLLTVA